MCRVLTGAGYKVDLATYPFGEDVSLPGLEIHRAWRVPGIRSVPVGFSKRKLILDLVLGLKVISLLARRRYAIVHAVEESVFLALPFLRGRSHLIYDLDSLISDQLRYSRVLRSRLLLAGVERLERVALTHARAAVTVCQSLTEAVRRLSPTVKVFQIEDAPLEETLRQPDPTAVESLRQELDLVARRVVVYTGNLESYQGIDLLVASAVILRRRIPEVAIVLVGGDPRSVEHLCARLDAEGLEEIVVAVGSRPATEMPDWMGLADALVSPRTAGGNTPLKVYTYMHSGVPVVATDLPTHTQVLQQSTSVLCEPTPQGLADALAWVLTHPEEARELGRSAQQDAHSSYSLAAFRGKLLAAYAEILRGAERD
jgi:glycosyltransferase involved in cell wall biosynthesis